MKVIRTSELDMQDTCEPQMIDEILSNVGWAICSTQHTMLGSLPGSAVFGRDMLFAIPYLADWADIGRRRQEQVDKSTVLENKLHLHGGRNICDQLVDVTMTVAGCRQHYSWIAHQLHIGTSS